MVNYCLCGIDEVGHCAWLILDACLFVMAVDEVDVIGQDGETSPEEEAVDPPAYSISILF
jgi:hypothetical protein